MGAGKNKKHATYSVSPTTKAKHHPAAPATAATASGGTTAAPVPHPSSSEPAGAPSPGTAAGAAGAPAQQVAAVADTEDHTHAANSGLTGPIWSDELAVTTKEEELAADGSEVGVESPELIDANESPTAPGAVTVASEGTAVAAGAPKVDWADAAYPVPGTPAPGEVMGTPVLIGGADLEGSSATLRSYLGPAGPREVLMATVNQDAEAKLLEALAVSETKMVPVQVEKEVTGRLPMDTTNQLHERLSKTAKSVNHHLHQGQAVPAHTHDNVAQLEAELAKLEAGTTSETELAMIAAYRSHLEAVKARLAPGWSTPYSQGGKVPFVDEYHATGTATVTEYIPAPVTAAEDPLSCPTTLRNATRVKSFIAEGKSTWDGKARSPATGKEYVVDLGDGYTGIYRPYAGHDPKKEDYSLRGSLEVIAPAGAGHGRALVERLGRMNLVNRPMTKAEGEWAYLARNIEAQGLGPNSGVSKALTVAGGVDEAALDSVFAAHADQAVGMDEAQLSAFAQRLALEAEASSLPTKVKIVREAVAKATGHANGAVLAASAGYDPTPRRSGGWLVWDRFDVAANPGAVKAAFGGIPLHHNVSGTGKGGGDMLAMFKNGGCLASTERRRHMGTPVGLGMSESADMKTGGSNSVFLRRGKPYSGHPALVWDDPSVLLRRSDWYAYPSDHFGSLNSASGHSTSGLTRDPAKVATFSGNNEVMFRDGLDLLGADAPSRVLCGSAKVRDSVLAFLKDSGISKLGGRDIIDVVRV
jgi:hypothetical protein